MMKLDSAAHPPKQSQSDLNTSKTIGASSQSKVSQKSASFEFSQTPNKYRRRPLTQDEIDLVAVNKTFYSFPFIYLNIVVLF